MDRLTERLTDKSYCISDIRAIQKEVFYEDMECRHGFDLYTGKAIDKLAEYEDLEEQGKLPRLPCAEGDIIYTIRTYEDTYFVDDSVVEEVSTHRIWADSICFDHADIGKSIFFTEEDAQAALERTVKRRAADES